MIRKLFSASVVTLALLGTARAQDATDQNAKPASSEEKPADADGAGQFDQVPGWSIKPEVGKLNDSMKKFNSLIGSLNRASKDLSDEFQKYVKDPKNEVVASNLERKMASYAAQVQGEFSAVISEQDALSSNFRMLRRKLQQLSNHLGTKAGDFQEKYKSFADEARKQEKELIDLAVKIKENPPEDPEELKKLKRDFLMKQRRYMLKERYVKGYGARVQNYQQLRKNLEKLSELFVALHDRFGDLMENLSNERTYLKESMELQRDTLEIKRIIRDGIFGGEGALKNVSEKLLQLYGKVDAFTSVHDRINSDLNKFIESQTTVTDVMNSLDKIGDVGGFGTQQAKDIDSAIDEIYKKKDAPLSNADDDVLKGTKDGTNEGK
ncbi:MAG TPA: hypothetical protein VFF73_27720 [Planctomycetota bacterium]|nr:hypothetical protein [Planctomycetota bacterium]